MTAQIKIDPTDPAPIWRQIEEQVRQLVSLRVLSVGAMVPSVRELARALRVNPATVAKAYQRLCQEGVLEVRRGEGTFVAALPPPVGEAQRNKTLATAAERYAAAAICVGASYQMAQEALRQAWPATVGEEGERV